MVKKPSFIKSMRIILFAALSISVIWNALCLLGFLPLKSYTATYAFVSIPSIIISFRSLFFRSNDTAAYIGDAVSKEKIQAGIFIFLIAAWAITIVACLVY